jgi:hypothetical protein
MSIRTSGIRTRYAAVGPAILALAFVAPTGCGGTGERQVPDVNVASDAGTVGTSCPLDNLETQIFGCPAGQGGFIFCMDFEASSVTDGFSYDDSVIADYDQIVSAQNTGQSLNEEILLGAAPSDFKHAIAANERHCGNSANAEHFVAQNQLVYGPQFGQQFLTGDVPGPVDVTDWEGIAFWIRLGADYPELKPTGTTLFVSLRDPNTISVSPYALGSCDDSSNIDSQKCDPYGAAVGFTTDLKQPTDSRICDPAGSGRLVAPPPGTSSSNGDAGAQPYYCWRFVMIPFNEMKQRGYGVGENGLIMTQIEQVTFGMDIGDGANGNWNLWVDDVVQYRRKPIY